MFENNATACVRARADYQIENSEKDAKIALEDAHQIFPGTLSTTNKFIAKPIREVTALLTDVSKQHIPSQELMEATQQLDNKLCLETIALDNYREALSWSEKMVDISKKNLNDVPPEMLSFINESSHQLQQAIKVHDHNAAMKAKADLENMTYNLLRYHPPTEMLRSINESSQQLQQMTKAAKADLKNMTYDLLPYHPPTPVTNSDDVLLKWGCGGALTIVGFIALALCCSYRHPLMRCCVRAGSNFMSGILSGLSFFSRNMLQAAPQNDNPNYAYKKV